MYTVTLRLSWQVFPCFFLSCKANAWVKPTKTEHGPHSSKLVVICVVLSLFVLLYLLFLCKCLLHCHRVLIQLQLTNMSYNDVTDNVIVSSFPHFPEQTQRLTSRLSSAYFAASLSPSVTVTTSNYGIDWSQIMNGTAIWSPYHGIREKR